MARKYLFKAGIIFMGACLTIACTLAKEAGLGDVWQLAFLVVSGVILSILVANEETTRHARQRYNHTGQRQQGRGLKKFTPIQLTPISNSSRLVKARR